MPTLPDPPEIPPAVVAAAGSAAHLFAAAALEAFALRLDRMGPVAADADPERLVRAVSLLLREESRRQRGMAASALRRSRA